MLASAQIRQVVAQRLAACALTGGRVFEGRYEPAVESELPCWAVSIESEDWQSEGYSWPALLEQRVRLRADGFVVSATDLEALFDTMQVQGLQALFGSQPPMALRCVGVRRRVDETTQAARLGALILFLEAVIHGIEGQPETLIP